MEQRDWICQIRPGNPYNRGRLSPEDFFRPENAMYIVFEEGIQVEMYSPHSRTIIVKNKGFCVVKKPFTSITKTKTDRKGLVHSYTPKEPNIFHVCLPERVQGREVVFASPNINPLTIK